MESGVAVIVIPHESVHRSGRATLELAVNMRSIDQDAHFSFLDNNQSQRAERRRKHTEI